MSPWEMNKALVATVGGIVSVLEIVEVVHVENHECLVTMIASVLTPVFVYWVPNKGRTP